MSTELLGVDVPTRILVGATEGLVNQDSLLDTAERGPLGRTASVLATRTTTGPEGDLRLAPGRGTGLLGLFPIQANGW